MNATTLILLLLLLACPLAMFFMHRGGGGHSHGLHDDPQNRATESVSADPEPPTGEAHQAHGGCGHAGHGESSRHDHSRSGTPA